MSRVLLNIADQHISELVVNLLTRAGYDVVTKIADDLDTLTWLLDTSPSFEALLGDAAVYLKDNAHLLARLTAQFPSLPIIMIAPSANTDTLRAAIMATRAGAADYLIIERLRSSLVQRLGQILADGGNDQTARASVLRGHLKVGKLRIDRRRMLAYCQNEELNLSPTEFRILYFLMMSPKKVISFEHLASHLQDMPIQHKEARRMLSAHMSNLRSKLNKKGCGNYISNRRGHGYVLDQGDQDTETEEKEDVRDWRNLNMGFIIAYIDLDGIIRHINPPLQEVLGYTPNEFIGTLMWKLIDYIHPEDQGYLSITEVAQEVSGFHEYLRFQHKDGHYVLLEVQSTTVLTAEERIEGFIFVAVAVD